MEEHLKKEFNIFRVTHYAHFIIPKRYREEFESLIERIDDDF